MLSPCTPQQASPVIRKNKTLQPEKIQVALVISFFSGEHVFADMQRNACKRRFRAYSPQVRSPCSAGGDAHLPGSTMSPGIRHFWGANTGGGWGARGWSGVVPKRRRRRRKRRRGQPRRGGGGCGGQRSLRRAGLCRAEPSRAGLNWAQAVSRKAEQSRTEPACAEPH